MPRPLLQRRYWDRVKERQRRRHVGVQAQWRLSNRSAVDFIDYWPWLPATLPERMVFAALVRRQINFAFSYFLGDIPITEDAERFRPDFILLDYNVIIEVYGVYWHTRPGMFEHDFVRTLILTAAGYKVYILTDHEVLANVDMALNRIPELASAAIHGNTHLVGDRPFDPRAAIRGRMRRWPRVFAPQYRDRVRGDVGVLAKWRVGRAPLREIPQIGPMFQAGDMDRNFDQWADELGQSWLDYMEDLDVFFGEGLNFVRYRHLEEFWEIYWYWREWKDWRDRFRRRKGRVQ